MGFNLKLGKGGHGLEVYDSDGKYADEFSFELEGVTLKNYDDFRSLYFSKLAEDPQLGGQYTANDLENLYQQNEAWKNQVDSQLYDEYNKVLTLAVEEHNATQVWDTPEEAEKNLHEIITPSLVQNLIENNILTTNYSKVTGQYSVVTFAACVQMSRYKTHRTKLISQEEFDQRYEVVKQNYPELSYSSEKYEYQNMINDAIAKGNDIYVNRGTGTYGDVQEVLKSFYDENSPRHSCLARNGKGYLGSVVYASMGDEIGGGTRVKGLVRMSDKLKLLECPLTQREGSEAVCNRSIPEINRFRTAILNDKDFKNRMIDKFKQGSVSDEEAGIMYDKFKRLIDDDVGFCAMLMGYDAIYGLSCQFDVLNLGIWEIVNE